MKTYHKTYKNLLANEIKETPAEYLPALLNIVRLFRETVSLKPAEKSLRQGWKEATSGETMPINELWAGI